MNGGDTIVLTLTEGTGASGRRPDFSGTWEYDPERSTLQIDRPERATVTIEHKEPHLRFSRTLVVRGEPHSLTIDLTTDGREHELHIDLGDIRARLDWEGAALVFDTLLARAGKTATNVVRYELSRDGLTLTARERFRSQDLDYDNVWVMARRG